MSSLPSPVVSDAPVPAKQKRLPLPPPASKFPAVASNAFSQVKDTAAVPIVDPPRKTLLQRNQETTQRYLQKAEANGMYDADAANLVAGILERTSDSMIKMKQYFIDMERHLKAIKTDLRKSKKAKKS